MAHTATRIYIDTSVTPHLGITHDDMRSVLGVSGNNMGLILQQAQNSVKPFAKYKATRCGGFHPTDWWKGPSKTIYDSTGYTNGLDITAYDSLSALKTAMDGGTLGWTWERPRGNTVTPAEWQVRRDFNGYEHASTSPFERVGLAGDTYPTQMESPIYLYVEFSRSNSDMLGLSDFAIFNNWYFGFALYNANRQLVGIGTSSTALGNSDHDASRLVKFTPPANAAGNCSLYPFFSRNAITWRQTEPSGTRRFVPLPIGIQTITVVSGGPLANLNFTFGSGGSIAYRSSDSRFTITFPTLTVANSGNSLATINKDALYTRVHIEKAGDPMTYWDSDLVTMSLSGTLNVPANGNATVFSSGQQKVFNDTDILTFLNEYGGSFTDYRRFAYVYYRYNSTDFLIESFEV